MNSCFKLLLASVCMFLGGCSNVQRINVAVDTILNKQDLPNGFFEGDVFAVAPDVKDQPELLTKEIQRKIEKALVNKGYKVDVAEAEYYLIFRYTNTSSSQKVDVTIPSQSSIYATESSASIYKSPEYSSSYNVVTYHRGIGLFVYDARAYARDKEEKILWQGTALSSGASGDFRYTSNFLLFPLIEYFGQDTVKRIDFSFPVDSQQIETFAKQVSFLDSEEFPESVEGNHKAIKQ